MKPTLTLLTDTLFLATGGIKSRFLSLLFMLAHPLIKKKQNNIMIKTWTIRSVTVALAGLALAMGESTSQGQEVKEEAAVTSVTRSGKDREFLSALDLARPDLAAVKAAFEKGDLEGAKAALAEHFRTRQKPAGPPVSPDGSPSGIAAADELVAHIFRLGGCPPAQLGARILRTEDPHHYEQWTLQLNRHHHWVTLGRAYAATKDARTS